MATITSAAATALLSPPPHALSTAPPFQAISLLPFWVVTLPFTCRYPAVTLPLLCRYSVVTLPGHRAGHFGRGARRADRHHADRAHALVPSLQPGDEGVRQAGVRATVVYRLTTLPSCVTPVPLQTLKTRPVTTRIDPQRVVTPRNARNGRIRSARPVSFDSPPVCHPPVQRTPTAPRASRLTTHPPAHTPRPT